MENGIKKLKYDLQGGSYPLAIEATLENGDKVKISFAGGTQSSGRFDVEVTTKTELQMSVVVGEKVLYTKEEYEQTLRDALMYLLKNPSG
jgi:hypothetical protein